MVGLNKTNPIWIPYIAVVYVLSLISIYVIQILYVSPPALGNKWGNQLILFVVESCWIYKDFFWNSCNLFQIRHVAGTTYTPFAGCSMFLVFSSYSLLTSTTVSMCSYHSSYLLVCSSTTTPLPALYRCGGRTRSGDVFGSLSFGSLSTTRHLSFRTNTNGPSPRLISARYRLSSSGTKRKSWSDFSSQIRKHLDFFLKTVVMHVW